MRNALRMFISFYLILIILNTITSSLNQVKKQSIVPNNDLDANKCTFIGCGCKKNLIECPKTDTNEKLSMFPKRYNGKHAHANLTLKINNNLLEKIPDDRFASLDMYEIDFSYNKIYKLSTYVFRDIQRLENLDLNNNLLNYIHTKLFEPVKYSLVTVNLNENILHEMQASMLSKVFDDFSSLKNLYLSKNLLVYIPNLSHSNLTRLVLSHNRIESLVDQDTFQNLLPASVVYLDLEDNQIKQINDYSFTSMHKLEELNLGSNKIAAFAESSFANLKNLRVLILRQNNLMHIPSRIFYPLVNLEELDFSRQNKYVKKIEDYAFDRVSNLKPIRRVDLSRNYISIIENRAFCSKNYLRPYASIKELDLYLNPLKNLNSCIMRQLYKGYNNRALLKTTSSQFGLNEKAVLVECDCEVTRSNKLIDLVGSCFLSSSNITLTLKNYECGIDGAIKTLTQLNAHCLTLPDYDCAQSTELDYNPVETFTTPHITTTTLLTSTNTHDLTTLPKKGNASFSVDDEDDEENREELETSLNKGNTTTKSNSIRLFTFSTFYFILLISLIFIYI
jgi:hypothetical protein